MEELKKTCNECNKEFTLDKFYNNKTGIYGKTSKCRVCMKSYYKKYQKKYYEKNKEKLIKKSIENQQKKKQN